MGHRDSLSYLIVSCDDGNDDDVDGDDGNVGNDDDDDDDGNDAYNVGTEIQ